jgi:hypothetical protein
MSATTILAVCCLLFAVCCLLSAVCCLLSAVCCLLSAVCCLLSAVCCLLFAVCCLRSTVCCQPFANSRLALAAYDLSHQELPNDVWRPMTMIGAFANGRAPDLNDVLQGQCALGAGASFLPDRRGHRRQPSIKIVYWWLGSLLRRGGGRRRGWNKCQWAGFEDRPFHKYHPITVDNS